MGGRGASSGAGGQKYLRFGEVPKNGRSINWLSLTLDDKDIVSYDLENGGKNIDNMLKEEHYEKGVSVFELNKNGMPVINTLQLMVTLSNLLNDSVSVSIVAGKEVGRGNDSEPLLGSVKSIKGVKRDKAVYEKHILDSLKKNFKNYTGNITDDRGSVYVDMKNGSPEVHYKGMTFTSHKKGFNVSVGYKTTSQKSVPIRREKMYSRETKLSDYLKRNKVSVKKYVSKTGKNMVSYEENGRTVTLTESQYSGKTVTEYYNKWE